MHYYTHFINHEYIQLHDKNSLLVKNTIISKQNNSIDNNIAKIVIYIIYLVVIGCIALFITNLKK